MNQFKKVWFWLITFIDVPSGVIMGAFTGAIIYRIVIGDNIDMGTASCYATAIGAFAGTKMTQHIIKGNQTIITINPKDKIE